MFAEDLVGDNKLSTAIPTVQSPFLLNQRYQTVLMSLTVACYVEFGRSSESFRLNRVLLSKQKKPIHFERVDLC